MKRGLTVIPSLFSEVTLMFPRKTSFFLGSFLWVFLGSVHAQDAQIDWGSSAVVDKIVTSDGSAISLAEFTVEIGGFANDFVPTASNVSQWVANWRIFDAITVGDSDSNGAGGSSADGYLTGSGTDARFAGTAYLQSDQTSASEDGNGTDVFASGQQAYVFIRNGDYPMVENSGVEWLLYTNGGSDGWNFPTVSSSQPNFPEQWFAGDADTAVWGAVNGTTLGSGLHTDTSADFLLRTHTFVPEPSVVVFSILGALLLARRERM